MDRRKLVLLVVALVFAVGAAFAARSMFAGASAPEATAAPEPLGPKVLVAQRALPTGTIITADAMSYQQWPEELVQDAYFIDGESDVSQLLGTVVRHPVTAGEPVTQGSLVSPGDRGFLAAALGPGMRAVTVPVSAKTGVAGFVFPGDRVDMVLTMRLENEVTDAQIEGAETFIRNLRVLATDQSTEQTTTEDGQTQVKAFRTVTLEVTPKLAEQIAVAQTMGTLSLVLRSIADNEALLERAIAKGEVKIPDNATPEEEASILRAAANRPIDGNSSYQTSFDVSRLRTTIERQAQAAREEQQRRARAAAANNGEAPRPNGPTVRVTRGKQTQEVSVGGLRTSANGLRREQAGNVREAGQTVPAAGALLIR